MKPASPLSGLDFLVKGSPLTTTYLSDQTTMAQPAENTQPSLTRIEPSPHSADSRLREPARGHVFLGQLLTFMWQSGTRDIEVLKSEVDRGGYDVVLESNGVIRHVQLKSSFRGSKVREADVSTKLLRKPGGCILWLEFDRESLAIERYYWFGSKAGNALPDLGERISRHSKGNSEGEKNERPIHRVLTRGRFNTVIDAALARQGLSRLDIYVTQTFHLVPRKRSAWISQAAIRRSFDEVNPRPYRDPQIESLFWS